VPRGISCHSSGGVTIACHHESQSLGSWRETDQSRRDYDIRCRQRLRILSSGLLHNDPNALGISFTTEWTEAVLCHDIHIHVQRNVTAVASSTEGTPATLETACGNGCIVFTQAVYSHLPVKCEYYNLYSLFWQLTHKIRSKNTINNRQWQIHNEHNLQ